MIRGSCRLTHGFNKGWWGGLLAGSHRLFLFFIFCRCLDLLIHLINHLNVIFILCEFSYKNLLLYFKIDVSIREPTLQNFNLLTVPVFFFIPSIMYRRRTMYFLILNPIFSVVIEFRLKKSILTFIKKKIT